MLKGRHVCIDEHNVDVYNDWETAESMFTAELDDLPMTVIKWLEDNNILQLEEEDKFHKDTDDLFEYMLTEADVARFILEFNLDV